MENIVSKFKPKDSESNYECQFFHEKKDTAQIGEGENPYETAEAIKHTVKTFFSKIFIPAKKEEVDN